MFSEQLTFILEQSERLPFGDLTAVGAIYKTSLRDDSFLYKVVKYLVGSPPIREEIDHGFKGLGYFENTGFFEVPLSFIEEDQKDIKTIANHFPCFVLSQLAIEGLEVEWEGVHPKSLLLELMEVVGSYPDFYLFLGLMRFKKFPHISCDRLQVK